ncbi:MAG TPA: terminase family protein [Gemmatimonadaceae bacterium]
MEDRAELTLAARVARASAAERALALRGLSPQHLAALEYEWPFWARRAQLAPEGEWTHWGIVAGRGSGKTRAAAEWVRDTAKKMPGSIGAFVGRTAKDVRDTMVELGPSSILQISPPDFRPKYEPSKARLTWPNGTQAVLYSSQEPNDLRGPNHAWYWADEVASWIYPDDTWDNLMLGLRAGAHPRGVFTTTPRPIKLVRLLMGKERAPDGTFQQYPGVVFAARMTTYENIENLAPSFIEQVVRKYEGTRLARQELGGELLLDVPGALWTLELIEQQRWRDRIPTPAELARIVVALDPAVTSDPDTSNETGIICVGRDRRVTPHFYVFADDSGTVPAFQWATRAVNRYRDVGRWENRVPADRIVGEVNNGGDLVEAQIRMIDRNVSYKAVHASRGKRTRGEPVAALYEQGRVHHCGSFDRLEDQMITWVPAMSDESPDRADALVWGLTELADFTPPPPPPRSVSRRTFGV